MYNLSSALRTVTILTIGTLLLQCTTVHSRSVTIKDGKIQGITLVSRLGKPYYAYLGIPYGSPPEGNLRFQPPQPAQPWKGVRDASNYGPSCAQFDFVGNTFTGREDCLYLNVYSPSSSVAKHKLLPVIVFIHGGYFQQGGTQILDSSYLIDESVVVVTIAYRLGAFGFLSTGDEVVPGNNGLKDQLLALTWIRNNIPNFRGDPNRVTISGTSSGAASVHFLVLSQRSKGLFRRAISFSGTALAAWACYNRPKEQAQRLAGRLNCPTKNSNELLQCLQSKSVKEIANANVESSYPTKTRMDIFVPVVESRNATNGFLTAEPAEILKSGEFNRVEFMSGVMASEGTYFSIGIQTNATFRNLMETQWDDVAEKILNLEDNPEVFKRLKSQYFHMNGNSDSNRLDLRQNFQNYVNVFSDNTMNYPLHSTVQLQSKFSPVYLYYFDYIPEFSFVTIAAGMRGIWPATIELLGSIIRSRVQRRLLGTFPPFHAASHGDDMLLEFALPGFWIGANHPDYKMSRDLVKSITDFASVEDLKELTFRGVKWPAVYSEDGETQKSMRISDKPAMIIPPYTERLEFWNRYYKY